MASQSTWINSIRFKHCNFCCVTKVSHYFFNQGWDFLWLETFFILYYTFSVWYEASQKQTLRQGFKMQKYYKKY